MSTISKHSRSRAFSIVESIAAAGIISLILILSLALIPSFKMSNLRANQELEAGRLAQSVLEKYRAKPFEETLSMASEPSIIGDKTYSVRVDVEPGSVSKTTKRVRVSVAWEWKERRREIFRETILARVPR